MVGGNDPCLQSLLPYNTDLAPHNRVTPSCPRQILTSRYVALQTKYANPARCPHAYNTDREEASTKRNGRTNEHVSVVTSVLGVGADQNVNTAKRVLIRSKSDIATGDASGPYFFQLRACGGATMWGSEYA